MKKYKTRIFLGLLFLIIIFNRESIFCALFSYKIDKKRASHKMRAENIIMIINKNNRYPTTFLSEIINTSQKCTSEKLNFTFAKCNTDPNLLINYGKTNCIGYATFATSICNYLLERQNMKRQWVATPYIAEIYFCDVNIHPFFNSSFFKDHDIVVIENLITHQKFAFDPSLNDYFGIYKIRLR